MDMILGNLRVAIDLRPPPHYFSIHILKVRVQTFLFFNAKTKSWGFFLFFWGGGGAKFIWGKIHVSITLVPLYHPSQITYVGNYLPSLKMTL